MELSQTGPPGWVPQACTLPSAEQPLRVAEFDGLFTDAVRSVERAGPGRLRLGLAATPQTAGRAAELVARETACCSFFTFTLTAAAGELALEIMVPPQRAGILDALARAAARAAAPA
jgi:hypothetical protein